MKKLLALALTMMMAFTLAACSNNNNGTQKEKNISFMQKNDCKIICKGVVRAQ